MTGKKEIKTSFKELFLLYRKLGYGNIARTYYVEDENKFYNIVVSKLARKYPKLVKYEEAYNLLKDNGQIVTIDTLGQRGFYDEKRNIIGIRHFLTRLTTTVFHEIVHKLGYLVGKGEIYKLPNVYREAGTEYVTAETLKTKNVKACVFSNIWGRFPNTISSYYLDYIFVNQLNLILGDNSLEESILKGNLKFENSLKQKMGIIKYDVLTKKMTEINRDFFEYSACYKVNTDKKNEQLREKLTATVDVVQYYILRAGFDEKISSVKTPEEASKVLDEMLRFSDFRLRKKENGNFIDREFQIYFNKAKSEFYYKFPKASFNQIFIPNDWNEKYADLERVIEIKPEEEKQVKKLGRENYKKFKDTFLNRMFSTGKYCDFTIVRKAHCEFERNFNDELKVRNLSTMNNTNFSNKPRKILPITRREKPRDEN
ncbi:MAG: hypothetical protein IKL55_01860 [Clostridia bacterium]|nr:hypothetical protein [Clostridia bacterium]